MDDNDETSPNPGPQAVHEQIFEYELLEESSPVAVSTSTHQTEDDYRRYEFLDTRPFDDNSAAGQDGLGYPSKAISPGSSLSQQVGHYEFGELAQHQPWFQNDEANDGLLTGSFDENLQPEASTSSFQVHPYPLTGVRTSPPLQEEGAGDMCSELDEISPSQEPFIGFQKHTRLEPSLDAPWSSINTRSSSLGDPRVLQAASQYAFGQLGSPWVPLQSNMANSRQILSGVPIITGQQHAMSASPNAEYGSIWDPRRVQPGLNLSSSMIDNGLLYNQPQRPSATYPSHEHANHLFNQSMTYGDSSPLIHQNIDRLDEYSLAGGSYCMINSQGDSRTSACSTFASEERYETPASSNNPMGDSQATLRPQGIRTCIQQQIPSGTSAEASSSAKSRYGKAISELDRRYRNTTPGRDFGYTGNSATSETTSNDCLSPNRSAAPFSDKSSPHEGTPEPLYCDKSGCIAKFTGDYRRGNRSRHIRLRHGAGHSPSRVYKCEHETCDSVFRRQDARLKHYRRHHPHLAPGPPCPRKARSPNSG